MSRELEVIAAVRKLKESHVEDLIRRAVEAAPPLTDEQRRELALLLLSPREAA